MSVLKRIGLFLLLLLLLLLAVLAWATMTHGGMQRLFALGQSYITGELTIGESTGAVVGPASFTDVAFKNDSGMTVQIDSARFDWSPKALFRRTARVDELFIEGITIRLPPPAETAENSQPFELRDFALPLNVDVKDINITDLKVYQHGATEPFVLNQIKLDASGQDSSVKLVELSVDGAEFTCRLDGTVDMRGAWPLDLNTDWTFRHEAAGQFAGQGTFTGDTDALRVNHRVTGAATLNIDAVVTEVTGQVKWDGNISASVEDAGVFTDAARGVPLAIDADTSGSLEAYQAQGTLESGHPLVGKTLTDFDVSGDLNELQVHELLTRVDGAPIQLAIEGKSRFNDLQTNMTMVWSDVQWPVQNTDQLPLVITPSGELNLNGTPDKLRLTGGAQLSSTQTGALDLSLDVISNSSTLTINELLLSPEASDTNTLAVKGNVDLEAQSISIAGQIDELAWPLITEDSPPLVEVSTGAFNIEGPLDNYQLTFDADIAGKDIPDGSWSVTGNGSQSGFSQLDLLGKTLNGGVNGEGAVNWQPQVSWRMDMGANNIDPSVKWPAAQGNIDLQLSSTGRIAEDGLQSETRFFELDGTYRDQPLSGNGGVLIEGGNIQIDKLVLNAGDASIEANGSVSDDINISWEVDLPDLEQLVPDTSGDIKLNGNITGKGSAPSTNFSVSAQQVSAGGVRIGSLSGKGNVDLSGGEQSSIDLSLSNIVSSGQQFKSVRLKGAGTPGQHQAQLIVDGDVANVELTADGGLADGLWKGTVDTLNISNADAGDWILAKPAQFEASAGNIDVEELCLESKPSSLCVDGGWTNTEGVAATTSVDSLNTVRFKRFLPPDLNLDALVNAKADIAVAPGDTPVVTADITMPGGRLDYLDGGTPKTTTLGDSRIQLELRNDNLTSDVDLDFGNDIGTVNASTTIDEVSGAQNLGGMVKADIKDISPVSAFAPGLDSFDGALNTNMELAGSISQPRVAGNSELDELVLEVPSVAMKLIDGKIIARGDGKGGLRLSGTAKSGDGIIELAGNYNPEQRKLDATIKGNDFRVANAKRQNAVISPDLKVNMDGDDIKVSGLLHIPSAFIDTGASSGLIKESPDVVLINAGETQEQAQASRVSLDVRVTLGDDIKVKAGQFSGALAGELAVEQIPGAVPTGVGTIEVVSGDFIVYGQTLTMERGLVLFGGGPVTNPALEFDVARDVAAYNVKAGARIRGTAQAPILQLQSEPAQTDANTLSYILLGTPVDTAGVSYTLGRYITPDIYVSYARDLFTQAQTFSVRYRINDRLTLIASSSENVSGSDLVYTFER